ncbi:MAG TPA: cellulase family glycosylhydrolase, partial [Rectinemataceae bacterium]|nr:cellulase family glycosylhydrolase [Rectinemataceae bacterium]
MQIIGESWRDEEGRRLVLRGVNLGGDCKVPSRPEGATHLKEGFYQRRGVSFVGRPFPLAEADAHFRRLKRWGMNFLRLLVTWEAVEHDGPGIYDHEYLDYIEAIVAKACEWGFAVLIDPHQDVWSRWTGGDGAPIWTLEAVGLEPERLHASGAALLHQELGEAYPRMKWFSNGSRLGCATMFSLFFGGDAFAPGIEPLAGGSGESIQ